EAPSRASRCPSGGASAWVWSVAGSSVLSLTGSPTIVSRKEWGASSLTCSVPLSLPVAYLITEQLSRMECQDRATCSQMVRVLQSHSIYNKGWCDVAFNFLVGQDGGVYEGVGWNIEGSHTYGYNDIALGIAFMGNFVEQPPNAAALKAAQDLIQCAVAEGYLIPNYLLMGHSDVSNILSPGQALYDIIRTWPHFKH
ncbi:Peptidoglycan recognition protein 3, partial [Lemmus lemmus]